MDKEGAKAEREYPGPTRGQRDDRLTLSTYSGFMTQNATTTHLNSTNSNTPKIPVRNYQLVVPFSKTAAFKNFQGPHLL